MRVREVVPVWVMERVRGKVDLEWFAVAIVEVGLVVVGVVISLGAIAVVSNMVVGFEEKCCLFVLVFGWEGLFIVRDEEDHICTRGTA